MVIPDPLRYLDVAVSDVPAAIRFYREAFEAIPGPAGSDELRMNDDEDALVLTRGRAAFVPAADGRLTVRGAGRLVQADVP